MYEIHAATGVGRNQLKAAGDALRMICSIGEVQVVIPAFTHDRAFCHSIIYNHESRAPQFE